MRWLYLIAAILFLAACAPTPRLESPLREPMAGAISYLHGEYNPDLGLIRESPESFPDRHWLATDNWLAAHALAAAGKDSLATQITDALVLYNAGSHGLIEALADDPIEWPPRTATQVQVDPARPGVWMEERTSGPVMEDWYDYVDLRMYGAINAINGNDRNSARDLYVAAVEEFEEDGLGFRDKAFDGFYATYKLALTLYVGSQLGEPTNEAILQALLAKQAGAGGFTTLYDENGEPVGDTNTETTSYALLALAALANAFGG